MKKKSMRIRDLAFAALLIFSSCSNESAVREMDTQVLDLSSFSYEEADSIILSGNPVLLKDGEKEILISRFAQATNVEMNLQDQPVAFYEALENDSVTVSICSDFVSIRIGQTGDQLAYLSYAETADLEDVIATLSERNINIQSSSSSILRSASGNSIKMNLTAIQKEKADTTSYSGDYLQEDMIPVTAEMVQKAEKQSGLSTRATSYEFPRNKKVTIYLLTATGTWPIPPISYEIVWQEEKVYKSIADVFRNKTGSAPTLTFKVEACDFKSTEKSSVDIANFRTYVLSNPTKYPTGGKDVFFFVRWDDWGYGGMGSDDAVGRAYADAYHINSLYNSYAFGISATSILYPTVLAHEMGHMFGVTGHSTTPWYRLNSDVMNATLYPWVSFYHRTDINQGSTFRNAILSNLTQQ
jgi:hypothetical protein